MIYSRLARLDTTSKAPHLNCADRLTKLKKSTYYVSHPSIWSVTFNLCRAISGPTFPAPPVNELILITLNQFC